MQTKRKTPETHVGQHNGSEQIWHKDKGWHECLVAVTIGLISPIGLSRGHTDLLLQRLTLMQL